MTQQEPLPMFDFSDAVGSYARGEAGARGAIFTRREVVEFILDLAGYTVGCPLHQLRLLEPSFGNGDFLLPVVERLLAAYEARGPEHPDPVEDLSGAIRAVEVHGDSIEGTRTRLLDLLLDHGIGEEAANEILEAWIIEGDFLLVELPWSFTHAVGNPPYVRQELIPDGLMAEYRARYSTIYDRADLYVPFFERSLAYLEPGGTLDFICADRWMKNRYGGPLRAMVANYYHLAAYVDMVDTPAFRSEVIAYPAITVIRREKPGPTRVARQPRIESDSLVDLARAMSADSVHEESGVLEISGVAQGREPWILGSFDQLKVARRLEAEFPTLEEAGCRVGIGVATGADRVYIGPYDSLDVEPDRKLPLATTGDIESGNVEWRGLGVINPFRGDGSLVDLADYPKLVDLADYPKLARYLEQHEEKVRARNCAKKNPKGWYRTIDRIHPNLTGQPKLLIPDIKGEPHIVYEDGHLYPHHNLYYITSSEWDLKALRAVLRSGIAKLFVSIYSTQMRGGYLRFQAQYLRRIRLPRWSDVPKSARKALTEATNSEDTEACSKAVIALYLLTPEEAAAMGLNGEQDHQ